MMGLNNLKISFFLAKKSITKGNKSTIALTILIMALAYINLVFISSILMGIIDTMNRQAINNQVANIVIEPEKDETYIKQVRAVLTKVNSVPGVIGSSAHYATGAVFSFDENKDGENINTGSFAVKSIDPADEKKTTIIYKGIVSGSYLDENDRNKIILGKEIAGGFGASMENQALGVKVGDKIELSFKNGIKREYEIKGVFDAKNIDSDLMAFITRKEMESILNLNDRATEIIVKTRDTGNEEKYIRQFRDLGLTKEEIKPWKDYMGMVDSLSDSLGVIRIIISIIGLVVAGITIFIVIFISVINKRKQIGILRAIGIEEKIIIRSYVIQAMFYAILGVGMGLFLTYFFLIPYFEKNPLDFPMGPVGLVATFNDLAINSLSLIAAAIVAGFIPSWQATREDIVKAIWGAQ
ncbi:MAG: FtsX-like permease family protein [Candidatus Paceibacterota bacterium]|jgi:putative ABC transport system permease protein